MSVLNWILDDNNAVFAIWSECNFSSQNVEFSYFLVVKKLVKSWLLQQVNVLCASTMWSVALFGLQLEGVTSSSIPKRKQIILREAVVTAFLALWSVTEFLEMLWFVYLILKSVMISMHRNVISVY